MRDNWKHCIAKKLRHKATIVWQRPTTVGYVLKNLKQVNEKRWLKNITAEQCWKVELHNEQAACWLTLSQERSWYSIITLV